MNDVIIRRVSPADVKRLAGIEEICFPKSEADSYESFQMRVATFPQYIFVAQDDETIVGFINGCVTDSPVIYDELFHDVSQHMPDADNVTVFGLDVLPEFRGRGIAGTLLEHFIRNAEDAGKKSIILTCKEHLIRFYESFGFVNNGKSNSRHGGAQWFDMTLQLVE